MDIVAIVALVHTLSQGEPDFAKFKENTETRYADWEKDHDTGSRNQFLNDKFLELMWDEAPKDEKSLRKVIFWVAMYSEWEQEPSSDLKEMLVKYKDYVRDIKLTEMNFKGIEDKILTAATAKPVSVEVAQASFKVEMPKPDEKATITIKTNTKTVRIETTQRNANNLDDYIRKNYPESTRDDIILLYKDAVKIPALDKDKPIVASAEEKP